jgi:hypothetical protein
MHFTSVERVIAFVALVPGTFNYLRRRLFHPSQDSDRARVEEEISASRNCHEPSHAIVVESYKDLQSHLVSAALSADNFPALQTPKSRISTARKRTCMSLERITADTHTIHTHTSYIYKVPSFIANRESGWQQPCNPRQTGTAVVRRIAAIPNLHSKKNPLPFVPTHLASSNNRTEPNPFTTRRRQTTANTTPAARDLHHIAKNVIQQTPLVATRPRTSARAGSRRRRRQRQQQ